MAYPDLEIVKAGGDLTFVAHSRKFWCHHDLQPLRALCLSWWLRVSVASALSSLTYVHVAASSRFRLGTLALPDLRRTEALKTYTMCSGVFFFSALRGNVSIENLPPFYSLRAFVSGGL